MRASYHILVEKSKHLRPIHLLRGLISYIEDWMSLPKQLPPQDLRQPIIIQTTVGRNPQVFFLWIWKKCVVCGSFLDDEVSKLRFAFKARVTIKRWRVMKNCWEASSCIPCLQSFWSSFYCKVGTMEQLFFMSIMCPPALLTINSILVHQEKHIRMFIY